MIQELSNGVVVTVMHAAKELDALIILLQSMHSINKTPVTSVILHLTEENFIGGGGGVQYHYTTNMPICLNAVL